LKSNTSEFFSNRDYNIKSIETEPEFIYQPNSTFRLSFTANYREKENTSGIDNEKSIQRNMGVELNYRVVKKGSFLVKFNYIKIDYNNVTNNAIAYEMLESLQPGNNVTWSVSYQRSLASNVQLNLIYDGRKVPEVSTIHIGNVMIRAYF